MKNCTVISSETLCRRLARFLLLFLLALSAVNIYAQQPKKAINKGRIVPSLNAYSFDDLLQARDKRNNQPLYTLFDLLDWCSLKRIPGLDVTGYYFPGYPAVPPDDYIVKLKTTAARLGVVITGTGIRNNFASPDPAVRAADVALAKQWIAVAAKLGAPVLRLFAGEIPKGYENKWDEVAGWMVECYKECAAYGQQYGVKIGIQNHGDMLQTASQCLSVLKAVDSDWAGLIIDTGNFKTADPYLDIKTLVPYAVNWQVKESPFGIGNDVPTDYSRLVKILKQKNYNGFLPVETLLVRGKTYQPFIQVPEMLQQLRVAIAAGK